MRRRMWCLVLLPWLVTPAWAATSFDCRIVAPLSRLYAAQTAVLAGAGTDPDALQRMRVEMASYSFAGLAEALLTFGTPAERRALTGLGTVARQVMRAAGAQDAQALHRLMSDPAITAALAAAWQTLARYDCKVTAPSVKISAETTRLAPTTPAWRLPAFVFSAWFYLVGLLLVAGGGGVASVIVKRRQQSRRRSHRYAVNRSVTFSICGATLNGAILDVSCFGVKLRHDGQIASVQSKVAVVLLDQMRSGRVAWLNAHYAGVLFDHRIRIAEVLRIVAGSITERGGGSAPTDPPLSAAQASTGRVTSPALRG